MLEGEPNADQPEGYTYIWPGVIRTIRNKKMCKEIKNGQKEDRNKKVKWWKHKMQELQEYVKSCDSIRLYRVIKAIVVPRKKSLLVDEVDNRVNVNNKTEQMARWRD